MINIFMKFEWNVFDIFFPVLISNLIASEMMCANWPLTCSYEMLYATAFIDMNSSDGRFVFALSHMGVDKFMIAALCAGFVVYFEIFLEIIYLYQIQF